MKKLSLLLCFVIITGLCQINAFSILFKPANTEAGLGQISGYYQRYWGDLEQGENYYAEPNIQSTLFTKGVKDLNVIQPTDWVYQPVNL